MDHKVSKDMISSGMTPSGEKTQADLGRTQYGSAPSPSKLMNAYKSMYKEENIDEMAGEKPTKPPYTAGQTPTETRTRADKDRSTYSYKPEKYGRDGEFKIAKKPETTVKQTSDADKEARRARVKEMQSKGQVRQTSYEKVDLLSAYRSVYEHHKKDADGNTIPHEGEELNEFLGVALGGLTKVVGGMAGKAAVGAGAKTAAAGATKAAAAGAGKAAAGATKTGGMLSKGKELVKTGIDKFKKMDSFQKFQTYQIGKDALNTAGAAAKGVKGSTTVRKGNTGTVSADVDLFDIVKGQLLDEGLSEEEIKDIMLTLTPDEIMKEIEESSLSAGSGTGTGDDMRSDGGDGVFRTKTQVANMFNKNIPAKRNNKVDKFTRKAVNTSARDMGIQGPTTLKQSVEPEGETI